LTTATTVAKVSVGGDTAGRRAGHADPQVLTILVVVSGVFWRSVSSTGRRVSEGTRSSTGDQQEL
jgi:hypothetical protein